MATDRPKHSAAALIEYVMGSNPERVAAAREVIDAEREQGASMFARPLTSLEQRRAGMPPPSRRAEATPTAERTPQVSELDDESLDKLQELVEAERERRWNDDSGEIITEDATAADVADYTARTDNPLSQAAVDAMDEKQRELFIKSGANASAARRGKEWVGGTVKWQRGEGI